MTPTKETLCTALPGRVINEKWKVISALGRPGESTGGTFSITFRAEHVLTGEKAFIKVVDVMNAIRIYCAEMTLADVMHKISVEHKHELLLANLCQDRSLNRIVRSLDSGDYHAPDFMLPLPYIVFELADFDTHGIKRAHPELDHRWWLRTLHHVAVGLWQLHSQEVSHQDLKPSNVVFFGKNAAKLADLGRAVSKSHSSNNDGKHGDPTHLPPELFYGYRSNEWDERYLTIDLFMLGSLAYGHFVGQPLSFALLKVYLESEFAPPYMGGSYKGPYSMAIPALESAFGLLLADFHRLLPDPIADPLTEIVRQLCRPNPAERGHPKDKPPAIGNQYSVLRYFNQFLRLSRMV